MASAYRDHLAAVPRSPLRGWHLSAARSPKQSCHSSNRITGPTAFPSARGRPWHYRRGPLENVQIECLVKALHAEAKAEAPTGRLFGQSLAVALAVNLAQRYGVSVPSLWGHRGGMPGARVNRVLEYICATLHEDLSLPVLAEIAGMNLNLYYFGRLFKESTGLSPHRYVLEQRIKGAQQLLRNSDMTVLEASYQDWFRGPGPFHEGVPPSRGRGPYRISRPTRSTGSRNNERTPANSEC
jgi:AraC-like DNA-binding protein